MIGSVSRRDVLKTATSASSLLILGARLTVPGQAATSLSLEQFIALSGDVTGQSSLDRDMGRKILEAFVAAGQAEDLAKLAAEKATAGSQAKIANAVVAAWYSGLSPVSGAQEVTGFNEALVWNALSYTKPWGNCGGETGYWSEPPAGGEP